MSDPSDPAGAPAPGPAGGRARGLEHRFAEVDPFWAPQLVVAVAIAVDVLLPDKLTVGPNWLLPSIEGLLLVVLVAITPHPRMRNSPLRRRIAIAVIGLVSLDNFFSLALLCHYLLHGRSESGRELVFAGVELWITNVLLFGLWYWELDRGGPLTRAQDIETWPDFMFPQTQDPKLSPAGWEPGLIDYLYVSFTNATAFSPTDTMPLTRSAKVLMTAQALTSLLIVALVVSRAVNILNT
jgi:uncharacterized membrane protein